MANDLQQAQEMYQDALDATREQRQQIEEDLKFSDPSNPQQWDETIKRQRENDPGGARPCLVMDHTGQYVANVAGQIVKSPPAIYAVPVGSGADVQVAEHLDGMMRHFEYASRAQTHYCTAATSAARTGVGYLIVRPVYTDRAMGYQEPRIFAEADPLRVVFDPWSVELDGSDATFGYLLTAMSEREFEHKYGAKAEKVSFGVDQREPDGQPGRRSIIVAEQWYKEDETRNVIIWLGVDGQESSGSEDEYWAACNAAGTQLHFVRNYRDKVQCVKWRTMSGAAILETPKKADGSDGLYPADYIGIVPVYGYWGISDKRLKYCGIPRRARNPQRAYNYHMSEQLAYIGSAPKSPWMVPVRAVSGLEALWDRASIDSRAWLPYNDVDEDGKPIAAPSRANISVNLQNHIVGAEQALHDLEATIGMYQANLGAPSNEQSGVAIDARKEQGEASTAHFPQNLSASLGQVGRIAIQMAAKLIDTKRQQRILGIDMKPGSVTVDPEQQEAVKPTDQGLIINPNVGKYDVRVVVGASYSTQRSQAQAALAEVMRNNPEMTPAIAPLWAQNLDIPHADKLAQVLTAMAPAPVQAILNPDAAKQPKPEQLMQQLQQAQGALKEAIQHAHDAQQEADEAQEQLHDKRADLAVKQRELQIKAYEAATKRLQVTSTAMTPDEIRMMVAETVDAMLSHPDPLPSESPGSLFATCRNCGSAEEVSHDATTCPGCGNTYAPGELNVMGQPPDPEPDQPDPAAQQQPTNPPSAGFSLPDPQQGA
jgi:rubrerythrin